MCTAQTQKSIRQVVSTWREALLREAWNCRVIPAAQKVQHFYRYKIPEIFLHLSERKSGCNSLNVRSFQSYGLFLILSYQFKHENRYWKLKWSERIWRHLRGAGALDCRNHKTHGVRLNGGKFPHPVGERASSYKTSMARKYVAWENKHAAVVWLHGNTCLKQMLRV